MGCRAGMAVGTKVYAEKALRDTHAWETTFSTSQRLQGLKETLLPTWFMVRAKLGLSTV